MSWFRWCKSLQDRRRKCFALVLGPTAMTSSACLTVDGSRLKWRHSSDVLYLMRRSFWSVRVSWLLHVCGDPIKPGTTSSWASTQLPLPLLPRGSQTVIVRFSFGQRREHERRLCVSNSCHPTVMRCLGKAKLQSSRFECR